LNPKEPGPAVSGGWHCSPGALRVHYKKTSRQWWRLVRHDLFFSPSPIDPHPGMLAYLQSLPETRGLPETSPLRLPTPARSSSLLKAA